MLNSQTHCDKRLRKETSEEKKNRFLPLAQESTLINL